MAKRCHDEPRFLWTGLLILLPVVALGGIGLWSLRTERASAYEEARIKARAEAERLVGEVEAILQPSRGWPVRGLLNSIGNQLCRLMIFGESFDVVFQSVQCAGSNDPRLSHPATNQLSVASYLWHQLVGDQ